MPTVLIIENVPSQRAEIRAAAQRSRLFERILEADDGPAGLRLLLEERVDLVLCDLELPGMNGDKLLGSRGKGPGGENVAFVFVTAEGDLVKRARLIEQGASDVIGKPFHSAELVARMALHLKVKRLQDELALKNATLARLSTFDSLTGLRTRNHAMEFLRFEFLRAARYETPLAVILADVDRLGALNDESGHSTGDAVLRGVAQALLPVRATDMAARFGGDEVLVVLTHNGAKGARVLAERWREAVAAQSFEGADGKKSRARISVGIAERQDGTKGPDDLLAAAERSLRQAKRGRP